MLQGTCLLLQTQDNTYTRCRILGVLIIRACSGNFRGASAHVFIPEIESSAFRPCWENGNNLKWVAGYRYLRLFSTISRIPTTLIYSPLFPVCIRIRAKIADPLMFPENSQPGRSPQPRHQGSHRHDFFMTFSLFSMTITARTLLVSCQTPRRAYYK